MKLEVGNLSTWKDIVKQQKLTWLESFPKQPDMNPVVIVERDKKVRAVIVARKLDKHDGLEIALMCRRGFAPDAITLVTDAHVAKGHKDDKDFMKKWGKPGSMQKACDEQGLCKTREITDCMMCVRIRANGKMQYVVLPYFYDEKYQGEFHWLDDEIQDMDEENPDVKLQGFIPDTLRRIMKEQTILDIPEMQEAAKVCGMEDDRDRKLYHGGRAICKILAGQGHMCVFLEPSPYSEGEEDK